MSSSNIIPGGRHFIVCQYAPLQKFLFIWSWKKRNGIKVDQNEQNILFIFPFGYYSLFYVLLLT